MNKTVLERLVTEKLELDRKIHNLVKFLDDTENAVKIAGPYQVQLMSYQLDKMLDYSCILNKRILTLNQSAK